MATEKLQVIAPSFLKIYNMYKYQVNSFLFDKSVSSAMI